MIIVFSDHAKTQLKRRGISQSIVTKTVNDPNEVASSFKSRKLRRKKIGDKILEIVTMTGGNKITAYYIKEKYEN